MILTSKQVTHCLFCNKILTKDFIESNFSINSCFINSDSHYFHIWVEGVDIFDQ
jgi:hypothetical protein